MGQFNDYDAWGDAISGASLRLACDAVETPVWSLDSIGLGGVTLQIATEGGGSLCYGENTQAGSLFFVPLTRAHEQVVNGESLDNDSLFVIPRGADFRIRVRRRAHAWCGIHFPAEVVEPLTALTESSRVACRPGAVRRLTQIVTKIAATLLSLPADTAAHSAAGRALIDAGAACLSGPVPSGPALARDVRGRPRLNRAEIIRSAMAVIEASQTMPDGNRTRTSRRRHRTHAAADVPRYLRGAAEEISHAVRAPSYSSHASGRCHPQCPRDRRSLAVRNLGFRPVRGAVPQAVRRVALGNRAPRPSVTSRSICRHDDCGSGLRLPDTFVGCPVTRLQFENVHDCATGKRLNDRTRCRLQGRGRFPNPPAGEPANFFAQLAA
jgi:hypothetical protein